MPLIFDNEATLPLQRCAITGDPKTGKTPGVLQLPWGSDYLGEAVYLAADDGAENLRSCPPELRKYLHVVKAGPDANGKYDPRREYWEIIMTDWRKKWPGVKTLVIDTMTEMGAELLSDIADSGQFSDKHVKIGVGTKYQHNVPMQGDFGAAQDEVARMLKEIFKLPLNVFVLFHLAIDETADGTAIVGGPATVGKATIRKVGKPFDAILRFEKKQVFDPDTKKAQQCIVIHSEATGIWIGGVRSFEKENPIPQVNVPMGKPLAAYWPLYFKTFYPEITSEMLAVREPVVAATNGTAA